MYDQSDHFCFITIYYEKNIAVRKIIKFSAKDFECNYLNVEIPNKTFDVIQKFFQSTARAIQQQLNVWMSEDNVLECNWQEIKGILPHIMRDKFIQRIQGMLKIKRLMGQLKVYKAHKKQEMFLQRFVSCYDLHYTEVKYFLLKDKYTIKILVKELNTIDAAGNMIEYKLKSKNNLQLRQKQFMIDLRKLKEKYDVY